MIELEGMNLLTEELFNERFMMSQDYIENLYKKDKVKINEEFFGVLTDLIERCIHMQKNGKKGDIKWLSFFYLKSSILMQTYEIQINLFERERYLDNNDIYILWKPDFIVERFLEDFEYVKERLKNEVIGLREMHLKEIHMKFAPYYYSMVNEYCKIQVKNILKMQVFQELNKAEDLQFTFGEYMGECIRLKEDMEENTLLFH